MNPIEVAMRRPVTMSVVALFLGGLPALETMCADILPFLIHVNYLP
jgi:hypothetical protein